MQYHSTNPNSLGHNLKQSGTHIWFNSFHTKHNQLDIDTFKIASPQLDVDLTYSMSN